MPDEMKYKIVDKNDVAIITIKGKISRDIEECKNQIINSTSKNIIFNFKDVTDVEHIALRSLVLLQHELRQNNQKVFVTGLSALLRKDLSNKGIIRSDEVFRGLEEVLKLL